MEIYSVSKALYHLDKLSRLQQQKQIAPTLLQVDPMAYCNDNCSFCSYRKDDGYNNVMLKLIGAEPNKKYDDNKPIGKPLQQSILPLELANTLPEMMEECDIPAIEITGGGEPTLWSGFDKLIEQCIKHKREMGIVTNGSNLSDYRIKLIAKNATWIRISMDSANEKTHKIIHKTQNYDFDRRLEIIKNLINEKHDDLTVGISFIITPENYNEIEDAIKLYKSIGLANIRFSWMYDKSGTAGLNYEVIDLLKSKLEKLKQKYDSDTFRVLFERGRIETYSRPNTDFKKCYIQHFVWSIGADANVYPCCIMKYHPEFALANLNDKTLKQIIEDQQVHKKMIGLDPRGCFPCWLRNRNKAIGSAVEQPLHHNFI